MNRQAFIDRLRLGLSGLPPKAIAEAVADYETHFTEGLAATVAWYTANRAWWEPLKAAAATARA